MSSLQVTNAARAAKKKNWRCRLDWAKLEKGLAIFLQILLLGWAILVFIIVLQLLNHTMFAFVLYNLFKGQNYNLHHKIWIKSPFLMLISCLYPFIPTPQPIYSNFSQYVMRSWLISVATATCVCTKLAKPACALSY